MMQKVSVEYQMSQGKVFAMLRASFVSLFHWELVTGLAYELEYV